MIKVFSDFDWRNFNFIDVIYYGDYVRGYNKRKGDIC